MKTAVFDFLEHPRSAITRLVRSTGVTLVTAHLATSFVADPWMHVGTPALLSAMMRSKQKYRMK